MTSEGEMNAIENYYYFQSIAEETETRSVHVSLWSRFKLTIRFITCVLVVVFRPWCWGGGCTGRASLLPDK